MFFFKSKQQEPWFTDDELRVKALSYAPTRGAGGNPLSATELLEEAKIIYEWLKMGNESPNPKPKQK
jgi:hypothetical protein